LKAEIQKKRGTGEINEQWDSLTVNLFDPKSQSASPSMSGREISRVMSGDHCNLRNSPTLQFQSNVF